MTHFAHLASYIPDLASRRILDIGAGRGDFVLDARAHGASAEGLELNPQYRERAAEKARARGEELVLVDGVAEELPFSDASFSFVNLGEVIEHVQDPQRALREAWRVLEAGGLGYLSVPNRFGARDQHFHLWGVNWLPRFLADSYIALFGKHKAYTLEAGHQRLSEMHYYTYGAACRLAAHAGFAVEDMRVLKLKRRLGALWPIAMPLYGLLRAAYLDSFHLLLRKA